MTTTDLPRGGMNPLPASVPIPGAALRELRGYEGSSQADLAQRLGISQQTVAVWERKGVPYAHRDRVRQELGEAKLVWAQLKSEGVLAEDLTLDRFVTQVYWAEKRASVTTQTEVVRVPAWPSAKVRAEMLASYSEIELIDELRRRADARGTTL